MSMICVPLRYEEKPVGVLKVYSAQARRFDDQDIETLELFSGLVGAHMAHAARFAASEHERLHDALTGLPNRRAYDERLARAAREGRPFCLCVIDVDDFKDVNETLGHPAGDAVLKAIAHLLRRGRSTDDVFRIGGDEFAVLMAETTAESARRAAWQLTDAIASARLGAGRVTASFGVAEATGHDALALQVAADQALYAAKVAAAG
jgi:diguanylate cyclase (GGDEF)-like protein